MSFVIVRESAVGGFGLHDGNLGRFGDAIEAFAASNKRGEEEYRDDEEEATVIHQVGVLRTSGWRRN